MSDKTLPSGHEFDTQRLLYSYLISASVWLLVGTTYGLLAAVKLYWPEALEFSIFSFGRIRPIHTNVVMFGWSSMALMGLALYVVTRTSKIPLKHPNIARTGMHCWNLCMVLAIITLSLGLSRGPQEYRELLWPIMLIYALGLGCNFYSAYHTLANRSVPEIYVSNWYIMGAFCWLAIIVLIGYLPFYQEGMGNIVIQGYYMHNAVGMWFTPMVLGITYYALPRMLGKPIYSYALGALGFWTSILFYTMVGAHHFIFSPVAWWVQTTAILFSVGMMVPVWSGFGNFFLTARHSWHKVRRSYAIIFSINRSLGLCACFVTGNYRSISLRQYLLALHKLHRWPLPLGHVRICRFLYMGWNLWAGTTYHGTRPIKHGHWPALLAGFSRRQFICRSHFYSGYFTGRILGRGRTLYHLCRCRRANVVMAFHRRFHDGRQPSRLCRKSVANAPDQDRS